MHAHEGGWGVPLMVAVAILALLAGPLVLRLAGERGRLLSAIDGFVLTSVGLLCGVVLLPHLVEQAGVWAVVALVAGIIFPLLLDKILHARSKGAEPLMIGVGMFALALHAGVDGVALGTHGAEDAGLALAVSVLVHRIPVGIAVWLFVRSRYGPKMAWGTLASVAAFTVVGASVGEGALAAVEGMPFALFQAFVAGSLLHVLAHPPSHGGVRRRWDIPQSVGAGLGVLLVILLPEHDHGAAAAETATAASTFGERFMHLAVDTAPALLLGYLLSGVVRLLPQASLLWLGRGSQFGQAVRGTVFGIPMPICSCGVVPLYQSLIKRGVPASAAMAFLVATPELGIESLLLSIPLLGGELTALRLGCAVVAAVGIGYGVGRLVKASGAESAALPAGVAEPKLSWARVKEALRFGFVEVVDDTAPWIVVGLVIAATLEPNTLEGLLAALPWGADVLIFAILGMPMYVCASGATPIAASLILVGVSPGAALAFLLAGPATNVTTFGVLSKIHGRKIALAFAVGMGVMAVALGLGVNLVASGATEHIAQTHEHGEEVHWVFYGMLGVVGLIFLVSFVRIGPLAFMRTVIELGAGHDHSHDHGHGNGHDHSHGHSHGHDHGHDSHGHDHSHGHAHDCGHDHDHTHGHECDHDHDHGHDHKGGDTHSHDHGHECTHDHDHTHGHECDHDHGHSHDHGHDHSHDSSTPPGRSSSSDPQEEPASELDHGHDHDSDHDHSHDHDHGHDGGAADTHKGHREDPPE